MQQATEVLNPLASRMSVNFKHFCSLKLREYLSDLPLVLVYNEMPLKNREGTSFTFAFSLPECLYKYTDKVNN